MATHGEGFCYRSVPPRHYKLKPIEDALWTSVLNGCTGNQLLHYSIRELGRNLRKSSPCSAMTEIGCKSCCPLHSKAKPCQQCSSSHCSKSKSIWTNKQEKNNGYAVKKIGIPIFSPMWCLLHPALAPSCNVPTFQIPMSVQDDFFARLKCILFKEMQPSNFTVVLSSREEIPEISKWDHNQCKVHLWNYSLLWSYV